MSKPMQFETRGYSTRNVLKVWPIVGVSSGHIRDGIVLEHDDGGCWVLSFADLEKIYLAAKASIPTHGGK